jgi:hypothetical protein
LRGATAIGLRQAPVMPGVAWKLIGLIAREAFLRVGRAVQS